MTELNVVGAVRPEIWAVPPEHTDHAFFTLTLAFENDPPCRWLYPEDDQYSQCFPIFAKAFGAAAIERGTALASHDFSGVAL